MGRLILGLFFLAGFGAMASPPAFGETHEGRGHLLLNGGGSKPQVVLELFVRLAGGKDAPIVVLPTASGEADTGSYYETLFREKTACTKVRALELHKRVDAYRKDFVAAVKEARGLWFSGGDQNKILEALGATPVGAAVTGLFERGGVIGGTSAGTACQSDPMITGDGDFSVIRVDSVKLAPGLGFFPGVIVDQHFLARRRQNRLLSVVLQHPELLGIGVDEATAVWLKPDLTFEVVGNAQVTVFDASWGELRRQLSSDGGVLLGTTNLRTHLLLPGEVFDLRRRRLVKRPEARDHGTK